MNHSRRTEKRTENSKGGAKRSLLKCAAQHSSFLLSGVTDSILGSVRKDLAKSKSKRQLRRSNKLAFAGTESLEEKVLLAGDFASAASVEQFARSGDSDHRIVINDTAGGAQAIALGTPHTSVVDTPGCTGTVIGPTSILTAQHCVRDAANNPSLFPGAIVGFHQDNDGVADDTRTVTAVIETDADSTLLDGTDIAILTLNAAVPAWAPPIPLASSNPTGVVAEAVGFGWNGVGSTGHGGTADGLRWGIENTVDAFGAARAFGGGVIGGTTNIFNTDFDDGTVGNNSLGSATPLTNEGTTAPGDSGGPLLVGGEIVGVLSGGTSATSQFGDVSWWTGSLNHQAFIIANAPGATFGATPPPLNDDFANAFTLVGVSDSDTGTNVAATGEVGEPNHGPSNQSAPLESIWWNWTAPLDGRVTIDTVGSDYDTSLGVYTGSSLAFPLTEIAGDDDSGPGLLSSVTFDADAGTIYRIAVDGYLGADGNVQINLDQDPEISIDDLSMIEGSGGGTTLFNFTVTRSHNVGAASVDVLAAAGATFPATLGVDFSQIPLANQTVNFADGGALTQTATVEVAADDIVEEDQTFFVNLSNAIGATILDNQGLGTIENDDELLVEFSQPSGADDETSGGDLPVLLIKGEVEKAQTVTIGQFVGGGNPATLGSDFDWAATAPLGVVTIGAGSYDGTDATDKDLITIMPDDIVETTEFADLQILSTSAETEIAELNANTGLQSTTLYDIEDDDAGVVTIDPPAASVLEGGVGTFTLQIDQVSQLPTVVDILVSGTAASPVDIDPIPASVTIPALAASVNLDVQSLADMLPEFQETVIVTLDNIDQSAPPAPFDAIVPDDRDLSVGTPSVATMLIDDDPTGGPFPLLVDYSAPGMPDHILVEVDGDEFLVLDGTTGLPIPGISPQCISCSDGTASVLGDADPNTLTVDESVILAGVPVTYDGGDPTASPGDVLEILDNSGGLTGIDVTYSMTAPDSGDIDFGNDGVDITFTGLEPVLAPTVVSGNVIFDLPPGGIVDEYALIAGAPGTLVLDSLNGTFEDTTFAIPTGNLTIRSSGGDDVGTISTSAIDALGVNGAGYTGEIRLRGQGGADTFTIEEGSTDGTTEGVKISINGNGDTNTLAIADGAQLNVGGNSIVTLINLEIDDPANDGMAPLQASDGLTTLKLDGVTMRSEEDSFIELDSIEPDVDLTAGNNTFEFLTVGADGSSFVDNDVVPSIVLFTDLEDNTLRAKADEDTSITWGVAPDGRTVTAASSPDGTVTINGDGTVTFAPFVDFEGTTTLSFTLSADGATGSSATGTIEIEVCGINDAPVNSLPASYMVDEDTLLTISGPTLAVTDIDSDTDDILVNLSVPFGDLFVNNFVAPGVSVVGSGSTSVTLIGTEADVTAILQDDVDTDGVGPDGIGVTYMPPLDVNEDNVPGAVTLTMTSSDMGHNPVTFAASEVLYANDGPGGTGGLFTIDESTGIASFVGGTFLSRSMGINPISGEIFADTLGGSLEQIDPSTGFSLGAVPFSGDIVALGGAPGVQGMEFVGATLYGVSGPDLVIIDPGTGVGTSVGPTGLGVPVSGLAYDDVTGTMYGITPGPFGIADLVTIDLGSGAATLVGPTGVTEVGSLEFAPDGMLYAGQNMFGGGGFFSIDPGTGVGTPVGPTGMAAVRGLSNSFASTVAEALTDVDTSLITIKAVNDAPEIFAPADFGAFLENSTDNDLSGVFISDDASENGGDIVVTLEVGKGNLDVDESLPNDGIVGDGTMTLTITGTVDEVNDLLDTLDYDPLGDDYDSAGELADDDELKITVNDQGSNGSGGALTTTLPDPISDPGIPIFIDGVNDAPVNHYSGSPIPDVPPNPLISLSTDEDISLAIPDISVSDVDVLSDDITVTLAVGDGEVEVTGALATGPAPIITLTGPIGDVNATLATLVYTPDTNFNGTDTLNILTEDFGSNGEIPPVWLTDDDDIEIVVSAVNDAPVIRVNGDETNPDSQSVAEDAVDPVNALVFNDLNNNRIRITDVDNGPGQVREVSVSVLHGQLTLGTIPGGAAFNILNGVDGTDDPTIVFEGTQGQINSALDGLIYEPDANYFGAETLTISVDDRGNVGTPGPLTDTLDVPIAVGAVNDAPVNLFDGLPFEDYPLAGPPVVDVDQTVVEDGTLTFTQLATSDLDAGTGDVSLVLTVADGTLTVATTTGTVTDNGTDAVTVVGTIAEVNAALNGLVYKPDDDYNGPDLLTMTVDDLGNTGVPGALSDTDTVPITVTPLNDAPSFSILGTQVYAEDAGPGTLTVAGFLFDVEPGGGVDEDAQLVTVTLSAPSNPDLFASAPVFAASGMTTLTVGPGGDVAAFPGTDAIEFDLAPDAFGAANFTISAVDDGGTATAGEFDTAPDQNFLIIVTPVNDEPVITVPASSTTDEDTPYVFDRDGADDTITVDDDAKDGPTDDDITVTLDVSYGTLDVATTAATVTNDGTASVTLVGTVSEIDDALNGLTYTPDEHFNDSQGSEMLTVTVDDGGSTGGTPTFGPPLPSATFPIGVTPVNDPVVNLSPTIPNQNVPEDPGTITIPLGTDYFLGSNYFDDADKIDSPPDTITITTAVVDDPDSIITSFGVVGADLAIVVPDNVSGVAELKVTASDGPTMAMQTFFVTVGSTNDSPVITHADNIPGPAVPDGSVSDGNDATLLSEANEGAADPPTVLTFSGADLITVSDVEDSSLTVTLDVPIGVLNLNSPAASLTVTGDGTGSITIDGPTADINAALDGATYTPPVDVNTEHSATSNDNIPLTITATDSGLATTPFVIDIHIDPKNDNPIANADNYTVLEDSDPSTHPANILMVLDNDTAGPTTALDELASQSIKIVGLVDGAGFGGVPGFQTAAGGTIEIGPTVGDGLYVEYTPPADFWGTDSFEYIISDDDPTTPLTSLTGLVTITVDPVNDAPVIAAPTPAAFDEDTDLALGFIDIADDFSPLPIPPLTSGPSTASSSVVEVELTATNGDFAIEPTTGVTVTPLADGVKLAGTVSAINVALDDPLSVYTPDDDFNTTNLGTESIEVYVNDLGNINGGGSPLTDTLSIPLTIDSVNDPPLLELLSDPFVVTQDAAAVPHSQSGFVTDRLPAGDEPTLGNNDEDGQIVDILSVTVISDPDDVIAGAGLGIVSIDNVTGELTFTANGIASGVATIEIEITDDGGPGSEPPATNTQTFDIQVGVNQEPLFVFDDGDPDADLDVEVAVSSGSTTILDALQGVFTGSDYDFPFGQSISTVSIVANSNPGLFTPTGQPMLTYTPESGPGETGVTPGEADLSFEVVPGLSGEADITLEIKDDGGTANGGDDTATLMFKIIVGTVVPDPDAPVIESVKFAGSDWDFDPSAADDSFLELVDPSSIGAASAFGFGHSLPAGADQAKPMPWGNIDTIYVQFSEDVGSVPASAVALLGVNNTSYGIDVAYDALTQIATVTLDDAGIPDGFFPRDRFMLVMGDSIDDAAGNKLDGEFVNDVDSFPTGDGTPGTSTAAGSFEYMFNVLPGDFNQDGGTNGLDLAVIGGPAYFSTLGPAPFPGKFGDGNGDGGINGLDLAVLGGANYFQTLPSGTPGIPSASPVRALATDHFFAEDSQDDDDDDALDWVLRDLTSRRQTRFS